MKDKVSKERTASKQPPAVRKPKGLAAHIAEGFAQAERGELIDPDEAIRILRERRRERQAV